MTSSIIAAGTVDLDGDAAITLGGLIQTTGGNDIEIATNGTLSMSGGLDTSNAGVDAAGSLNLNSSISILSCWVIRLSEQMELLIKQSLLPKQLMQLQQVAKLFR